METVLLLRGVVLAVAELASVAVAATHDELSSVECIHFVQCDTCAAELNSFLLWSDVL